MRVSFFFLLTEKTVDAKHFLSYSSFELFGDYVRLAGYCDAQLFHPKCSETLGVANEMSIVP